jgi:hypothetical protein
MIPFIYMTKSTVYCCNANHKQRQEARKTKRAVYCSRVLGEQHGAVEGDGDVVAGEVAAALGAAALPPARVGVGGAERAEQRDGEVLGQRVADEADAAAGGGGEERGGVDPRDDAAARRRPGQRRPLRRQL